MEPFAYPGWLVVLATSSLILAALCAAVIVMDICRGNKPHMWIMNVVWPTTA